MKVAIISPDDLSSVLFCRGIVEALQKQNSNCDIHMIADIWEKSDYYPNIIKSWGVQFVHVEMYRYVNLVKDFCYLLSLYKIIRREKFDVVICNCTKPNIYGTIAAKCAGVKNILVSVWGRGSAFVSDQGLSNKILKQVLIVLYRLVFKLSSKVWFTNINDHYYFMSHKLVLPSKIILTKNYVNTNDYSPYTLPDDKLKNLRNELGINDQSKVVIMVGRLIWAKGVREFVEASQIIKDKQPHVKFIFVGPKEEGVQDAVPESFMRDGEKSGNFLWLGFRKDVIDLYALADLAVLPSYYKEGGFPRALIEPMSMGKPLIAADCIDCRGPVEEGKNGYLVPARNALALADAIENLITNDKKIKEFGLYSRQKAVNELDEMVIVKQVIESFL